MLLDVDVTYESTKSGGSTHYLSDQHSDNSVGDRSLTLSILIVANYRVLFSAAKATASDFRFELRERTATRKAFWSRQVGCQIAEAPKDKNILLGGPPLDFRLDRSII